MHVRGTVDLVPALLEPCNETRNIQKTFEDLYTRYIQEFGKETQVNDCQHVSMQKSESQLLRL